MYDDNLFAVDTTGVDAMGGYEVYPAGTYPAMMISASRKEAKNPGNYFLECVYQFIEGDYAGRKYTSRLNLWNSNTQAVEIAKRELKSLRIALGIPDHDGSTQSFMHKPVLLNITVKPRKDKPDQAENNLVSIEAYGGAAPVQSPVQQPSFQPQAMPTQWQQPASQQQPTFAAPPMQAAPQQRPAAPPAFQPGGNTPPWMAGTR